MTPLKDTISLLDHLIAFPTVSTEPNLAMIDWLADRLETAGAEVEIMGNAEGSKANLWATLNPGEGGIVLPAEAPAENWAQALRSLWNDGSRYESLRQAAFVEARQRSEGLEEQEAIMREVIALYPDNQRKPEREAT